MPAIRLSPRLTACLQGVTMVSYDNLGDLADGRRLLIGDFRGIGRSQLLFNNASDRT